jgi:hypothetical protein
VKKLFTILLAGFLAVALGGFSVGCGGSSDTKDTKTHTGADKDKDKDKDKGKDKDKDKDKDK